ncbi:MAG: hypothetical protein ABI835_12270 [Chloroflexota bacterium]
MISQSDIQGRLRLLRYGLIVLVVVTFLVAWLGVYAQVKPVFDDLIARGVTGLTPPGLFDNLGTALIYTVVVAVIAVIIYMVYQNFLRRTVKSS